MSFTERTSQSWFSRMRNALFGILVGIILVPLAAGLLFWNEGRAITTYRALTEGAGLVVDVDASAPDAAHEGKLVHVAGAVTPDDVPQDPDFAIAAEGAVALKRSVEMYQWVEKKEQRTEKNLGGSEESITTYDYVREWSDARVKSEDFRQPDGHQNPDMPLQTQGFAVASAHVGGFTVDGKDVAGLGTESGVRLDQDAAESFSSYFGDDRPVAPRNGGLYAGRNPASPSIGDLRISYQRSDLKDASFVARQSGDRLGPYQTSNGHNLFLSASGIVAAADMFKDAEAENAVITWILRAAGMIAMMVGFSLIFSVLSVAADIIPFLGSLVGFGTTALALVLTLLLGPLVIAIGWFAYRPVLALSIIGGGAALAAVFWYLKRNRAPQTAGPVALGRPQA